MKPSLPNRGNPSPQAEENREIALEAIERFVRVLALTGMSGEEMIRGVDQAASKLPKTGRRSQVMAERELVDAAHVLTVWLSDPYYFDQHGEPLRLRLKGGRPSLEALLRTINPELHVSEVADRLLRSGSIVKSNGRYAIKKRNVLLTRDAELAHAHGLRAVLGVLRTIENNVSPQRAPKYWFEQFADNPGFPSRLIGRFDERLQRLGMDFLQKLDADMRRAEQSGKPSEPTVRMTVGIYRCEENAPARLGVSRSKQRVRTRG